MGITVDKTKWNLLKKQLLKAEQLEGKLGWFAEDRYGANNDNLPMAQVAAWNDQGHNNGEGSLIPGAETPPRPFMRIGLPRALESGVNDKEFRAIVQAVLDGKSTLLPLQQASNDFRDTLRTVMLNWSTPPNAPITVELKGFNDPLVNTGELIANVNYKVGKREVGS